MNGVYCPDIVVDTGATQTSVYKRLVTIDDVLDGGSASNAPTATLCPTHTVVKIEMGGRAFITTSAVSSTLPASALLGWDVPELMTYLAGTHPNDIETQEGEAFTTTRSQARQSVFQETTIEDDSGLTGSKPHIEEQTQELDDILSNLHASLFSPAGKTRANPSTETRKPTPVPPRLYRTATSG